MSFNSNPSMLDKLISFKKDSQILSETKIIDSIDDKHLKSNNELNFKKKKIYVSTKLPLSWSSSQYEKFETFSSQANEGK